MPIIANQERCPASGSASQSDRWRMVRSRIGAHGQSVMSIRGRQKMASRLSSRSVTVVTAGKSPRGSLRVYRRSICGRPVCGRSVGEVTGDKVVLQEGGEGAEQGVPVGVGHDVVALVGEA